MVRTRWLAYESALAIGVLTLVVLAASASPVPRGLPSFWPCVLLAAVSGYYLALGIACHAYPPRTPLRRFFTSTPRAMFVVTTVVFALGALLSIRI